MNIGYEEDELKPHIEPEIEFSEAKRLDILNEMGYSRTDIDDSLKNHKFDDIYATYLLLGRRSTDVSNIVRSNKVYGGHVSLSISYL